MKNAPPRVGLPRMSPQEIALLRMEASRSLYCVEFGCGGSTLEFLRQGIENIVSVESDRAWVSAIQQVPEVRTAISSRRLEILHADIGPVKGWGYPASSEHRDSWPLYAALPWKRYGLWPDETAVVLIDGRFRVACCLKAIEAILENGRRNTKILIHDFLPGRPRYRAVLDFCEIIDCKEGLVVLSPRANLDRISLTTMRQRFEFIPQ